MKYIPQLLIILLLSFAGELLHIVIPLPVPASIYGMILMFLGLSSKLIKPEQVKDAGSFLVSVLPILFVAPVVGIVDSVDKIKGSAGKILLILIVSTVVCFAVSGKVTEKLLVSKKEEA